MKTHIRAERSGDAARIREVNLAAFPSALEADLVDALRDELDPWRSFVAEADGRIVGHVLFTPVTIAPPPPRDVSLVGLGPMAVEPAFQGHGIGSALGEAAISELDADEVDAVVVLGHPEWYPRFGFKPAARFGLKLGLDAPQEAFLALELVNGALMGVEGTVHYHRRFDAQA